MSKVGKATREAYAQKAKLRQERDEMLRKRIEARRRADPDLTDGQIGVALGISGTKVRALAGRKP